MLEYRPLMFYNDHIRVIDAPLGLTLGSTTHPYGGRSPTTRAGPTRPALGYEI